MPIAKLLAAMGTGARFGPVVDGHSLPRDPFDPDAPEVSADVPMIIGTTETEGWYFAAPELLSLDEAAVRSRLKERLGADGDRIYDLFRQEPAEGDAERDLLHDLGVSLSTRTPRPSARRRSAARRPICIRFDGEPRSKAAAGSSPHCIEIPFAMQNHWQLPEMVGTGPELQPLADKVSGAWVAFARTETRAIR